MHGKPPLHERLLESIPLAHYIGQGTGSASIRYGPAVTRLFEPADRSGLCCRFVLHVASSCDR